jgi:hypothetical protein
MVEGNAGALLGAEVATGSAAVGAGCPPAVATAPTATATTASASRTNPAIRNRLLAPVRFGELTVLSLALVARVDTEPASGSGSLTTRP